MVNNYAPEHVAHVTEEVVTAHSVHIFKEKLNKYGYGDGTT